MGIIDKSKRTQSPSAQDTLVFPSLSMAQLEQRAFPWSRSARSVKYWAGVQFSLKNVPDISSLERISLLDFIDAFSARYVSVLTGTTTWRDIWCERPGRAIQRSLSAT